MVLAADRTGKGLRTAPRDALISLSSTPATRGRAFGVHRAMDTTGALLGPLAAFLILRATTDGYDAVFTVSFCVAALGVLVLLLFVPQPARSRAGDRRGQPPRTRAGDRRGPPPRTRAPHLPVRARSPAPPRSAPHHGLRPAPRPRHGQRLLHLPASPAPPGRPRPVVRAAPPGHGGRVPAPGGAPGAARGPPRQLARVPHAATPRSSPHTACCSPRGTAPPCRTRSWRCTAASTRRRTAS